MTDWEAEVRKLLGEGNGVEDIARASGVPADDIRAIVAKLRRDGQLPFPKRNPGAGRHRGFGTMTEPEGTADE